MDKSTKLAFRVLASLYPDRRPSEVRKIITEALQKEENKDDIELWMCLARETAESKEEKETPPTTKVIEEHHYHHYDYPWYGRTNLVGTTCTADVVDVSPKITCDSAPSNAINITPTNLCSALEDSILAGKPNDFCNALEASLCGLSASL